MAAVAKSLMKSLLLNCSYSLVLAPDYPYCLVSKELRNIIRSLLGRSSSVLELFFDHCVYTMLQELDKTPGKRWLMQVWSADTLPVFS